MLRNLAYMEERQTLDEDRLEYLPASITRPWNPEIDPRFRDLTEEDREAGRRNFEHSQHLVGEMNRAGVKIIAGTDVLNPFCFPGFSLHDELQLLVESGLSPMEALQAATRNAAEFSGRLDLLGTVQTGKLADLVLLDANPLDNISNTSKISTVILNGRVYDRDSLDDMLKGAKEMASADPSADWP